MEDREKVPFIHINCNNPVIWSAFNRTEVREKHYGTAKEGTMLSVGLYGEFDLSNFMSLTNYFQ